MESKNNECNILEVKSFSEQFLFTSCTFISSFFLFSVLPTILAFFFRCWSCYIIGNNSGKIYLWKYTRSIYFFRPSEKAFLSYFSRPSIFNTFLLYPYCGDDVGFKNKYIFFPTKQEQNNREVLSEVTTVDLSIYFHRI